MTQPYITATPNPVRAGDYLTICYTFQEKGPDYVELTVSFKLPSGDFVEYVLELDREHPCMEPPVHVPNTAISCVIHDDIGGSDDLTVTVL